MAQHVVSSQSTEYVLVGVTAVVGGTLIDPTGDTVQMAFVAPNISPGSGDWKAAGWEVNTVSQPHTYSVKCLIGPGGTITLSPGTYDAWVKITDNPESPIQKSGQLRVY
jgi:hypothetical protein